MKAAQMGLIGVVLIASLLAPEVHANPTNTSPAPDRLFTDVTPAEVDTFLARWWPQIQTNGLFGIAPIMKAETNTLGLAGKLLGALDRHPQCIWVFMLQIVVSPPRPGQETPLSPAQTVAVWKQSCAILEKWLQAADRDLDALALRLAKTEKRPPQTDAELARSLLTQDPHNNIARNEIRAGLDLARKNLAQACLAAGGENLGEVQTLARQLLAAISTTDNWNNGNIIYDAHSLLGRVALRQGDRQAAREELRAAGHTPGSPQLNSFGPQFDLARELLKEGDVADRDAVVAFLDDVAKFWADPDKETYSVYREQKVKNRKNLEAWKTAILAGKIPDDPKWR